MSAYPASPKAFPAAPKAYPETVSSFPAAMTPAALITGLQALNTWQLLCSADIGVSEATTSGRASAWADQSGNARNWATPGATNEPGYTAADSTLGGRASLSGNGSDRRMTNAWNPAAPGTTPFYRISVQKMNRYIVTRTFSQAATNRMGIRCFSPGTVDDFNPTVLGPVDYCERKWVICEEYFSNSTNDFLRVAAQQATGTNMGNTDPAAIALFASNVAGVHGDFSCGFYAVGALPADRAAVRALLLQYYGSAIKQTGSTVRMAWIGDSQTRHDTSYGFRGYRKYIFDYFDTQLNYFTRTCGNTGDGTWATNDVNHDGVSGSTIAAATTYLTGRYGSGGSVDGAGSIKHATVNLGAGDIFVGTAPATMLTNLEAFGNAWLTAETNSSLAFTNLVPYPTNPADLATFNAGIPTVISNLQGTYGSRVLPMIDINSALGGTYSDANYIAPGDRHMNEAASYGLCGPVIAAALEARFAALAA